VSGLFISKERQQEGRRGGTVFFLTQGASWKKYRSGGLGRGRREDDFFRIDAVNPLS
jgi:hypothetical protein